MREVATLASEGRGAHLDLWKVTMSLWGEGTSVAAAGEGTCWVHQSTVPGHGLSEGPG